MAKIRIIQGGCGIEYKDANGNTRHALKTPESGAFECDDAQAERLVGLGVAEYVGLQWREVAEENPIQEAPGEPTQETEQKTGHLDAEELAKMDYNELKALAADMGVVPKGRKKSDYIAALVAAEVVVDEDDGDDMPELSVADPE